MKSANKSTSEWAELKDAILFLENLFIEYPKLQTKALVEKINFLKEDLAISEESLLAKDSLDICKKEMILLANRCYFSRFYNICLDISKVIAEQYKKEKFIKFYQIINLARNFCPDSLHNQQGSYNPYPKQLLFSQQFHAPHFSSKSGREYVQSKDIQSMADSLNQGNISPDQLRLKVYLAPFHGKPSVFTFNNRTLVVFSRAKCDLSRVTFVLPTEDMMKRIRRLESEQHDPRIIFDEVLKVETRTLRP